MNLCRCLLTSSVCVYASVPCATPGPATDTSDWQYADTNPSLMFSQFNANADTTKPLGVVMLQHDLLQGT